MAPITIQVKQNGPYLVAGDVGRLTIVDHQGRPIVPEGPSVSLCRCGASANKPFCDGTHGRIGFIGTEAARGASSRT